LQRINPKPEPFSPVVPGVDWLSSRWNILSASFHIKIIFHWNEFFI
jgi:hypothetical protein